MSDQLKALLVVSADLPDGPVANARGPRKDYVALAEALGATVLDRTKVTSSVTSRLIKKVFGVSVAQAWLAARHCRQYEVVVTDGEHIGIPLALLLKAGNMAIPHVTIGHRISSSKKRPFFRWLRADTHIDRIALHSRRQHEIGATELGIPSEKLALVPYQVDPGFWTPQPVAEERLICSAGLEYRDYPVLMQAVSGLDVQVKIAAASHWSRRKNTTEGVERPSNVEVAALDYYALRDLYARSSIVVVPLDDVDFQAGVTTILEAMAMGKVVVVTSTQGQTDLVEDRRRVVRGVPTRPVSLLYTIAEQHGVQIEPNGFYVPPGDSEALRRAIVYLLDHPKDRAELGAAGRRLVQRLLTVDQFAGRMCELVAQACDSRLNTSSRSADSLDPDLERARSV